MDENNISTEEQQPEQQEKKEIICSKCGMVLQEDQLFCPKCGTKAGSEAKKDFRAILEEIPGYLKKAGEKIRKSDRKKLRIIIAAVLIAALSAGICAAAVKSVKRAKLVSAFEDYIGESEYTDAIKLLNRNSGNSSFVSKAEKKAFKIYDDYVNDGNIKGAAEVFNGILSETYHFSQDKVDKRIDEAIEAVSELESDYTSDKKEYKDVIGLLEGYKAFDNPEIKNAATDSYDKVEKLNASETGFEEGNKYYESNEYGKAVNAYSKVIESDENYDEAQSRIKELKSKYKTEVFDSLDSLVKAGKYDEALDSLNELKDVCEDEEIDAKIKEIEKEQYISEGKEAKKQQLVTVTSVKVYNTSRYITNMGAKVVIKNNSDKVVKTAYITIASFDKNGYPVQIDYPSLYGGPYDHMLKGKMETINIAKGESYGSNSYYDDLNARAAKAVAIVSSVEYTDGTTWDNPYYDYWVEEYSQSYS